MNYTFLKSLLDEREAYEKEFPGQPASDMHHFGAWLERKYRPAVPMPTDGDIPAIAEPEGMEGSESELLIGRDLMLLNRYLRQYAKKALHDTPLNGLDEYIYILVLYFSPNISKSELIYQNRHEKPTGMEIIRRLVQAGFIHQTADPTDGRSKLLSLTEEGTNLFLKIYGRFQVVTRVACGDLNAREIKMLAYLVERLERFHQQVFDTTRDQSFEGLVSAAGFGESLENGN